MTAKNVAANVMAFIVILCAAVVSIFMLSLAVLVLREMGTGHRLDPVQESCAGGKKHTGTLIRSYCGMSACSACESDNSATPHEYQFCQRR